MMLLHIFVGLTNAGILRDRLTAPIFIVGCGRSGTTFLGDVLAKHKNVVYFNEPRGIWARACPKTDIWSAFARQTGGELYLDEKDISPAGKRCLEARFCAEMSMRMLRHARRLAPEVRLVEKTPINAFRLRFLHALFPDARFAHIIRDGRAVANSIARIPDGWYGAGEYKWTKLVEYAKACGYDDLVDLARTRYRKGLLEWRLAVETARKDLRGLEGQVIEIKYEDLTSKTEEVIINLLRFCDLQLDEQVLQFAVSSVRTPSRDLDALMEIDNQLVGGLLQELGYLIH